MKQSIAAISPADLEAELLAAGHRKFVAGQVLQGVYGRNARSFDELTSLPKDLRRQLAGRYALRILEVAERRVSSDGSFKLALRLSDGHLVECAYLASGRRGTACLSSQVGCRMGCVFCASGKEGLVRNLEAFEMVEQVLLIRDHLAPGRRLANVTFMGIGEPLANFDALVAALDLINHPLGMAIGARKISVSTCGLVGGIRRLADLGVQIHLAVSLHAPNDSVRRRLVGGAGRRPIAEIIEAARYYFERTTRKVTFEYVLIAGLNDSLDCARELADLLGDFPAMVNLIPLNPVAAGADLAAPPRSVCRGFLTELKHRGVEACLRRRKGADLDAACGQLRARLMDDG
ncbi:MAG: 23S rRNA (adenine(2503)-C(2))-methyltransferase RlmN [Anaerolineaceae bacterium]|nr:23S rRNA (adenine(2503)-C(2))-methyltransferase RlmN [Anaerolineaceae bacterium]